MLGGGGLDAINLNRGERHMYICVCMCAPELSGQERKLLLRFGSILCATIYAKYITYLYYVYTTNTHIYIAMYVYLCQEVPMVHTTFTHRIAHTHIDANNGSYITYTPYTYRQTYSMIYSSIYMYVCMFVAIYV